MPRWTTREPCEKGTLEVQKTESLAETFSRRKLEPKIDSANITTSTNSREEAASNWAHPSNSHLGNAASVDGAEPTEGSDRQRVNEVKNEADSGAD